jgi:hypothetical protein
MAAVKPNISKGKWAYYGGLPAANDALVWVLFSGTETDDNLGDADTLTAVIALAVNEATFAGYARQTATGVTVTVDDTGNAVSLDVADPSWSPTAVEALTRIGLFYDPDTTGGTDADLIPIFIDDFAISTTAGTTLTYVVNASGVRSAS